MHRIVFPGNNSFRKHTQAFA